MRERAMLWRERVRYGDGAREMEGWIGQRPRHQKVLPASRHGGEASGAQSRLL